MAELVDYDVDLTRLIEGFDPSKLEEDEERELRDRDWETIYGAYQNDKILKADIVGIEVIGEGAKKKRCAIVNIGRVKGIIPKEMMGVNNVKELRAITGQEVSFMIEEYDREADIFIGSRIKAQEETAKIVLQKINVGDAIPAVIRFVSTNNAYADIGGITVKLPAEEYGYGWIDNMKEVVSYGDVIKVKVLDIKEDKKEKRKSNIEVSAKALKENPWPLCTNNYQVGGEYVATVSGVREYGTFVNLEPGVDSLATHMKYQGLKKGEKVLARINSINAKKEQIHSKIIRRL